MSTPLVSGAWYRLPDGTRLQAIRALPLAGWLLTQRGHTMPRYCYVEALGVFRCMPRYAGWTLEPCDLTIADLVAEATEATEADLGGSRVNR